MTTVATKQKEGRGGEKLGGQKKGKKRGGGQKNGKKNKMLLASVATQGGKSIGDAIHIGRFRFKISVPLKKV